MRFLVKAAGAAVVVTIASGSAALAGHAGCHGRAVECYEKVKLPDVYATQARSVVVRPGYTQVVHTPPVVINQTEKMLVKPGRWHAEHTPTVYGTRAERVLVHPAAHTFEHIPAVTRRVEKTVIVHPGGVKWEHRRGLFGREKLCKVHTPPVTRTVTEHVVVLPERRVARRVPALYQTVHRPVLIQRASVSRVYEAPCMPTSFGLWSCVRPRNMLSRIRRSLVSCMSALKCARAATLGHAADVGFFTTRNCT